MIRCLKSKVFECRISSYEVFILALYSSKKLNADHFRYFFKLPKTGFSLIFKD